MHNIAASRDLVDLHDAGCRTESAARDFSDAAAGRTCTARGSAGALSDEQGIAAEDNRSCRDNDGVDLGVMAAGSLIDGDHTASAGKGIIGDARDIQILGLHRQCHHGKRCNQPARPKADICNNDSFDKHATQFINFFVIVKLSGLKLGLYYYLYNNQRLI